MPVLAVDHVQLAAPAGCEAEARRFFGELLGLSEVEKPLALDGRGGVWFAVGAQQLHIGIDPAFVPARKAHPALAVPATEIEGLATRLGAAGVEVRWDEAIAGRRRFFCEDPWGNRLEFIAEA